MNPAHSLDSLTLGHTIPYGEEVSSVTLDEASVPYDVREVNRGRTRKLAHPRRYDR